MLRSQSEHGFDLRCQCRFAALTRHRAGLKNIWSDNLAGLCATLGFAGKQHAIRFLASHEFPDGAPLPGEGGGSYLAQPVGFA